MAETRPLGTAADNQHIDVAADARHGRSVAATIGVRSVPSRSTSTSTTSPGVRYQGGLRDVADTFGRAGDDHIAWIERQGPADPREEIPDAEDHVARIAVLHDGAVHAGLNAQPRRQVTDLVGGDDRPHRDRCDRRSCRASTAG